ncbi:MAG: hypothetical protein Q4E62_07435 [Sutterellaceae bacterium]|nr:hypothetical protein [Sutterellaceae bacterium]
MTNQNTNAVSLLAAKLTKRVEQIEPLIDALDLGNFPVGVAFDSLKVQKHPSLSVVRWDMVLWKVFNDERVTATTLYRLADGLSDKDEAARKACERLGSLVRLMDNFFNCVCNHTYEFCR